MIIRGAKGPNTDNDLFLRMPDRGVLRILPCVLHMDCQSRDFGKRLIHEGWHQALGPRRGRQSDQTVQSCRAAVVGWIAVTIRTELCIAGDGLYWSLQREIRAWDTD